MVRSYGVPSASSVRSACRSAAVSARASVVTRRRRSPYGGGAIDRRRSWARMTPSCRMTESAGATGLFELGEHGGQLGQGVVRVESAGIGEDPDSGRADHPLLAAHLGLRLSEGVAVGGDSDYCQPL